MANRILVVDDDKVTLKMVHVVLEKAGFQIWTCDSPSDALSRLEAIKPELIISDGMMPGMDGYELTRRLRGNPITAHTPIMILTSRDTMQEKIKGFEAGAEDYLTKPFEPAELEARVRALLRRTIVPQPETEKVKAKVIAVFSLRGGVGVSTLAANLAIALSQMWSCGTGLIDLVLTSGQSALMLNLPLRRTWADLARMATDEIDAEPIAKILLPHPSGTFVLAAPNRPEQAELLDGHKVSRVLGFLKERYQYLVLDLPHDFQETTLVGLENADQILLVISPDIASVHAAACALDVFDGLKYPREAVELVLNSVLAQNGLARKDIQDALQRTIDVLIPFAAEPFVTALNTGVPIMMDSAPSVVGALLEDLTYYLSRPEHQQNPASPTASLQRVRARIQQRQKRA